LSEQDLCLSHARYQGPEQSALEGEKNGLGLHCEAQKGHLVLAGSNVARTVSLLALQYASQLCAAGRLMTMECTLAVGELASATVPFFQLSFEFIIALRSSLGLAGGVSSVTVRALQVASSSWACPGILPLNQQTGNSWATKGYCRCPQNGSIALFRVICICLCPLPSSAPTPYTQHKHPSCLVTAATQSAAVTLDCVRASARRRCAACSRTSCACLTPLFVNWRASIISPRPLLHGDGRHTRRRVQQGARRMKRSMTLSQIA
jgi:hypothetical protein